MFICFASTVNSLNCLRIICTQLNRSFVDLSVLVGFSHQLSCCHQIVFVNKSGNCLVQLFAPLQFNTWFGYFASKTYSPPVDQSSIEFIGIFLIKMRDFAHHSYDSLEMLPLLVANVIIHIFSLILIKNERIQFVFLLLAVVRLATRYKTVPISCSAQVLLIFPFVLNIAFSATEPKRNNGSKRHHNTTIEAQ